MTADKNRLEDDIRSMTQHLDPSSITMKDIMKKLEMEDPSKFREVMRDL